MTTATKNERAILAQLTNEDKGDLSKIDDVRYEFTSSGHLRVTFYDHSDYFTVPRTYTFEVSRI